MAWFAAEHSTAGPKDRRFFFQLDNGQESGVSTMYCVLMGGQGMAGPATILREIHRLRRHAKDLQAELERGPRLLKGQQAKVARQEEAAREAHDTLKRLKVTSHEKEVLLKTKQQ